MKGSDYSYLVKENKELRLEIEKLKVVSLLPNSRIRSKNYLTLNYPKVA